MQVRRVLALKGQKRWDVARRVAVWPVARAKAWRDADKRGRLGVTRMGDVRCGMAGHCRLGVVRHGRSGAVGRCESLQAMLGKAWPVAD